VPLLLDLLAPRWICVGGSDSTARRKADGAAQDPPISFDEETGALSMRWTVGDGFITVHYLNDQRFSDERLYPTYQPENS
jgi:hypothetical protein